MTLPSAFFFGHVSPLQFSLQTCVRIYCNAYVLPFSKTKRPQVRRCSSLSLPNRGCCHAAAVSFPLFRLPLRSPIVRPSVAFLCVPLPPRQCPCAAPSPTSFPARCGRCPSPCSPTCASGGMPDCSDRAPSSGHRTTEADAEAKPEVKTAARHMQRQKSHPPCHMPDCSDRAPPQLLSLLSPF